MLKKDLDFDDNTDNDFFHTISPSRKWNTQKISRRGLAASAESQQRSILTRAQLLQCADAYTNHGILRTCIDKFVDLIHGDRSKFTIELSEELTEFATQAEIEAQRSILGSQEVQNLRQKIIRTNKKVELHDRSVKWLISCFVFGRSVMGIEREVRTDEWPIYGQPIALKNLNSIRIVDVKINPKTYGFDGYYYDFGVSGQSRVFLPSKDLIPLWFDDNNLYDNTMFSGISPIWPLINITQTDIIINDEDLPESAKQMWAKTGFVYTGTGKASVTNRFKDQFEAGTILFHNQEKLKAELLDLGRDIRELTGTRKENAMYILQALNFPLFFMFEDVPNHATAQESLAAFKAGTLKRYRTWIKNTLEKYWYDPIMADHLGLPIESVLEQKYKINATFEDITFDTFKDKSDSIIALLNAGIIDTEKALKELGYEDMLERLKQTGTIMREMEQETNDMMNEQAVNIDEKERQEKEMMINE